MINIHIETIGNANIDHKKKQLAYTSVSGSDTEVNFAVAYVEYY